MFAFFDHACTGHAWLCTAVERTLIWGCVCSGEQRSSAILSSSDDVAVKASGLQKDIDGVSVTANQLTVSLFVLLAWMVLLTVVLLSVVVLSCRRWRRQRRRTAECEGDDDSSFRSTDDASSVCSRPTTTAAACRDSTALEGVEIGRRSSSQASVDDAINNLSASAAEPWRVQTDSKNQWSSSAWQAAGYSWRIAVRVQPRFVKSCSSTLSDYLANVACYRLRPSDGHHCFLKITLCVSFSFSFPVPCLPCNLIVQC